MAVSKAQKEATERYLKKAYETMTIRMRKGKKDHYKEEAENRGLSLAMLIQKGVEEYIANHQPEKDAE